MDKNFGILTSISWNSNKWSAAATELDFEKSNYNYVKENGWMHEDLNFGHKLFPCEEDGTFIAYTPMFKRLPTDEVEIVFFRSLNYHLSKNYIIGYYAHPFIEEYPRNAIHKSYEKYDWGNVAAYPEDILLFENPIEISNEIVIRENYIPHGKKLGQRGFNYLTKQNVLKILDKATLLNPDIKQIKNIKFNFLTDPCYSGKTTQIDPLSPR